MNLDEFKLLKAGDSLMTLGTISSSKGEDGETFIVPAGTTVTVKTGEIFYVESIDDHYLICEAEYWPRIDKPFSWYNRRYATPKRSGEIAVNPVDVLAITASERNERDAKLK